MDIGTLTGQIAIEDQMTSVLGLAATQVRKFADDFDGAMGVVVVGAGLAVTAVASVTAAVTALGVKGSTIIGVEDAFNHLSAAVGQTGDELLGGLRSGVKGTIDDFALMEAANKSLQGGVKLTVESVTTLGQAARAMGKATGTDAGSALETLNQALLTGRTRALAMRGIVVDVKTAEENLAKSLGVTATQLSAAGQLEAKRNAILEGAKGYVDRLGESQLTFKEIIEKGEVAISNWVDKLAVTVAKSPEVMNALNSIGNALKDAFGGSSEAAIKNIVGFINDFANGVTASIPYVIGFKDAVVGTFKYLSDHRDLIEAIVASLLLYKAATIATTLVQGALAIGVDAVCASIDGALASMGAFVVAIGPALVTIASLTAVIYAAKVAWDNYAQSQENASRDAATDQRNKQNLIDLNKHMGTSYTSLGDAVRESNKRMSEMKVAQDELDRVSRQAFQGLNLSVDLDEKAALVNDKLTDAMKARKKALEEQAGALIPLTLAQAAAAESDHKLGLSAEQTAAILKGPTASAITLHLESLKSTKELIDYMAAETFKQAMTAEKQWHDEAIKEALAHGASYVTLLKAQSEYAEKNKLLQYSGVSLELANIAKTRDAAITALGDRNKWNEVLYDQAKHDIDVFYDHEVRVASQTQDTLDERMRKAGVLNRAELITQSNNFKTTYDQMVVDGTYTAAEVHDAWQRYVDSTKGQGVKVESNWKETWEGIKQDLNKVLLSIPQTIANAFTGGGNLLGAVKSIGSQLGSVLGKGIAAALNFAGPMGQAIGSAIGSLVGPAVDLVMKILDHRTKDFKAVGASIGVQFSDGLLTQLKTDAKKYGGEVQAVLVNLKAVVTEAGGLNSTNFTMFSGKLKDVFSMIETHQLTVAAGAKIMDDNWVAFATAGTSAVGVLNAKLVDIIKLNEQFKTQSKEIAKYIGEQGVAAATGIGKFITTGSDALTLYDQLNKKQMDLRVQIAATSDPTQLDQLNATLKDTYEQLNIAGPLWDTVGVKSKATLDAVSAALGASFEGMLDSGMAFGDAVNNITPAIQGLEAQMTATGLQGSEVFDALKGQVDLYADKIAGPALGAIDSLTQGMVALDNMGKGNQTTFEGLTAQVSQTFGMLVAQGKDGGQVMIAMRDSIQRVWEEEQQYGYVADKTTQALVDQAVADGTVGEKHKTTTQQMLDASNRMVDVLEAMAKYMGVILPEQAKIGASGIQTALDKITAPKIDIPYTYHPTNDLPSSPDGQNTEDTSNASVGGYVTSSRVVSYLDKGGPVFRPKGTDTVPAMLTPGERVLSVAQNREYENGAKTINVTLIADGREMARTTVRYIPDELKRQGII